MRIAFLIICTGILGTAVACAQEATRQEKERLQGPWVVVAAEYEGDKTPRDDLKSFRMLIDGDKLSLTLAGQSREFSYRLDPTHKPKSVDMTPLDGPQKGKAIRAIYELDGDNLKLCFPLDAMKQRPEAFTPASGSGQFSLVLQRAKP